MVTTTKIHLDQVDELSMVELRQIIKARNFQIQTVGTGRTIRAIRDDVKSSVSAELLHVDAKKEDERARAEPVARSKKVRANEQLPPTHGKRRKEDRNEGGVHALPHVQELKECMERGGAPLNQDNVKQLNTLSCLRATSMVDDFERIQTWVEHAPVLRKFALYCRGSLQYNKRDEDITSLIPEHVINQPKLLEIFKCKIEEIDNLFCANDWWSIGSSKRTTYFVDSLLRKEIKSKKHTCVSKKLIMSYCETHTISELEAKKSIAMLIKDGSMVSFENERFVTTDAYYVAEKSIFDAFQTLEQNNLETPYIPHPSRRTPTDEQRHAIDTFCVYDLMCIAGPGGTGKSDVCLREIMHLSLTNGMPVIFLGFTHVVRKLLADLITEEVEDLVHSQTLSSILKEPISTDPKTYVLDESSMINSIEFAKFIRRVKREGSRAVCCGDPDQLRPIEPGSPFADLVSHFVKHSDPRLCTLTRVFRAESEELTTFGNIYRTHKIQDAHGNIWSFKPNSPYNILPLYAKVVHTYFTQNDQEIDDQFRKACVFYRDMGVCEHRILCVTAKNEKCIHYHKIKREIFRNEKSLSRFIRRDQCIFSSITPFYKNGDRAWIHEAHNLNETHYIVWYQPDDDEAELLRSEMGKPSIERCNMHVEFVTHEPSESTERPGWWMVCVPVGNLIVGGCVTVHKAQGRGEDYCIATAGDSDSYMVRSDWTYTSVSRAKKMITLVGSLKLFNYSSRPNENPPRDTILQRLLRHEMPMPMPPDLDFDTVNPIEVQTSHDESRTEMEAGKTRRSKIRKAIRDAVWRRDCDKTDDGRCLMNAACCCCGVCVDKDHFHCAHIVSVFDGGTDAVDNLKICCSSCNESMGTINLYAFQRHFSR